jgi:DNA repair photolyase
LRYFFKNAVDEGYMCEPINGCSVGCYYCNAFKGAKRRRMVKNRAEWLIPKSDNIDINIFENELNQAIKDNTVSLNFIALCGLTDPFCNCETTNIFNKCKTIIENHNYLARTLTKSKIPDNFLKHNPKLTEIGITIDGHSLYEKHLKNNNVEMLQKLKENGFYVFISFQPLNVKTPIYKLENILENFKFVDQIKFGILDKYRIETHERQFKKAYKLSDIIANFCIENKISFVNTGRTFSKINRERLIKNGITKKILF